jgi:hypothetical protein
MTTYRVFDENNKDVTDDETWFLSPDGEVYYQEATYEGQLVIANNHKAIVVLDQTCLRDAQIADAKFPSLYKQMLNHNPHPAFMDKWTYKILDRGEISRMPLFENYRVWMRVLKEEVHIPITHAVIPACDAYAEMIPKSPMIYPSEHYFMGQCSTIDETEREVMDNLFTDIFEGLWTPILSKLSVEEQNKVELHFTIRKDMTTAATKKYETEDFSDTAPHIKGFFSTLICGIVAMIKP